MKDLYLSGQVYKLTTMTGRKVIASDVGAETFGDPVLKRFREALDGVYGPEIDRVVLFGSRARGDQNDTSDYDVAVFLKSLPDRWREVQRLADLRVEFLDETGVFFDAKPFPAAAYFDQTPIMHEIRRDGRDI